MQKNEFNKLLKQKVLILLSKLVQQILKVFIKMAHYIESQLKECARRELEIFVENKKGE